MITTIVSIYIIGMILTWMYAAYNTGVQFAQMIHQAETMGQPHPMIALSYVNIFFQGLCWIAYWVSLIGERQEKGRIKAKLIATTHLEPK